VSVLQVPPTGTMVYNSYVICIATNTNGTIEWVKQLNYLAHNSETSNEYYNLAAPNTHRGKYKTLLYTKHTYCRQKSRSEYARVICVCDRIYSYMAFTNNT